MCQQYSGLHMNSFCQESYVDSAAISVFSDSVESQLKRDILYSLIASRIMASSRVSESSEWYSALVYSLTRCAWTLRRETQQFHSFEAGSCVSLKDMVAKTMLDEALKAQLELTVETLDALASLTVDSAVLERLREYSIGQRAVKAPGAVDESVITVRLLLAVSKGDSKMDVIYLDFKTTESVGERFLEQAFLTDKFTSQVCVRLCSFEQATRAFANTRQQIEAFVRGHKEEWMVVLPGPGRD